MRRGNPIKLNFEGLKMQKWNIPPDRAERVNEKNSVIFLVIMVAPGVKVIIVIKMSKTAHDSKFH